MVGRGGVKTRNQRRRARNAGFSRLALRRGLIPMVFCIIHIGLRNTFCVVAILSTTKQRHLARTRNDRLKKTTGFNVYWYDQTQRTSRASVEAAIIKQARIHARRRELVEQALKPRLKGELGYMPLRWAHDMLATPAKKLQGHECTATEEGTTQPFPPKLQPRMHCSPGHGQPRPSVHDIRRRRAHECTGMTY